MIESAYKVELDPNDRQRGFFARCSGGYRFVFNWGLARWQEVYKGGGRPSAYSLKKEINAIKDVEFPWLRELPYETIEAAFYDLGAAFSNFFRQLKDGTVDRRVARMKEAGTWKRHLSKRLRKGAEGIQLFPGYPQFKRRSGSRRFAIRSMRFSETHLVLNRPRAIKELPCDPFVRFKEKGYLPVEGKHTVYARFSERAGRWYVAVGAERDIDRHQLTDAVIGIDFGLVTRAVLSTGQVFDVPKVTYEYAQKLARLNREQSRRKQGGQNWHKTVAKIRRLEKKKSDVREYWLHEISHHVTYELRPRMIVLEDLNVSGMLQNRRLAKAISDAGFFELRRQIEYKAKWLQIEVVIADRWFASSKTCSGCGHKHESLSLSERVFVCPKCGLSIDRDLNAAQNLAALGKGETHPDCPGS